MDRLSSRWRVLAPDLYGCGKDAQEDRLPDFRLGDELNWLTPVFERAGDRFHLVGHSYGGLLALLTALRLPSRVKSLVIYEPAAWSIAVHANAAHRGAMEIDRLRRQTIQLVEARQPDAAAENFVHYWAGPGVWESMPADRKLITARGMAKVRAEFLAEILGHDTDQSSLSAFSAITLPILYLTGSETKAAVRRLAEVLAPALVNGRRVDLIGLGHMGPVTHPDAVNREVDAFLASQTQSGRSK